MASKIKVANYNIYHSSKNKIKTERNCLIKSNFVQSYLILLNIQQKYNNKNEI